MDSLALGVSTHVTTRVEAATKPMVYVNLGVYLDGKGYIVMKVFLIFK